MNVYVIEPCDWGNNFEDCHIIAARSRQEVLALLNIKEKDLERISCDYRAKDWFKVGFLNVWRLKGVDYPTFVPLEIELDLIGKDDEEPTMSDEEAERRLREFLEKSEKVYQMCKEDAERRPTSAGLKLDKAISKHISEAQKKAIQELINRK